MESFFEWMFEASLLILMIIGIRRVFMGKIRYAGIYALWGLVLLRFLIPVNFISTPVSVENVISGAFSAWEIEEPSVQNIKGFEVTGGTQKQDIYKNDSGGTAAVGVLENQGQALRMEPGKEDIINQKKTGSTQANEDRSFGKKGVAGMRQFLVGVWLIISVLLFLWILLSNVSLLGKIKRDRVYYGEKGKLKIYTVNGMKNPCLYGFFHPAVYLPETLVSARENRRIDQDGLEQIITHEYVHYRHGDHIWAMFRMLLVSAYWFNPFVWLAASCSKKDAELCCDETVIRLVGEEKRFRYGAMLIRLAEESVWGDFRYSMMPISRKGKEMEKRIRAISGKRQYSKWVLFPLAAILCVTVGITCSAGMDSLAGKEDVASVNQEEAGRFGAGQPAESAIPFQGVVDSMSENAETDQFQQPSFEWLRKSLQGVGGIPDFNSDTKREAEREAGAILLWNTNANSEVKVQGETIIIANTPEEAFDNYIEIFTEAINAGNTDKMHMALYVGSEVYEQQCRLAQNYHMRGIREKVKSYSIVKGKEEDGCIELDSREKIKVFYADGSSKLVKQKYRYSCEQREQENGSLGWVITAMEEIA